MLHLASKKKIKWGNTRGFWSSCRGTHARRESENTLGSTHRKTSKFTSKIMHLKKVGRDKAEEKKPHTTGARHPTPV